MMKRIKETGRFGCLSLFCILILAWPAGTLFGQTAAPEGGPPPADLPTIPPGDADALPSPENDTETLEADVDIPAEDTDTPEAPSSTAPPETTAVSRGTETDEFTPDEFTSDPDNGIVVDAEGRAYYIVKKGDTLWDISQKFLNSAWYWPELWKVNSNQVPIYNPHLIYPGQRLRLYRRAELERILRAQEVPIPPEPELPVEPVPPPPEPEIAVPPSPPQPEEPAFYTFAAIDKVGFIRPEPAPPHGMVFKVRENKEMISYGDLIYIRERGPEPLIVGKAYTLYRVSDPIRDRATKEFIGYQHLLTGIVEIVKNEDDFSLGKVIQAFRVIRVKDFLMPYEPRTPKITRSESQTGLLGKILFSEEHTFLIGEYMTAFIDKGTADGIQPGQEYFIFNQENIQVDPDTREQILLTPHGIGSLLVLRAEPTASTVVITRSDRSIHSGFRFVDVLD